MAGSRDASSASHGDSGMVRNIYYGLWYPIVVALLTVVIGVPLVHETRHVKIHDEH